LVRVHATALNRADLLQRRGAYAAPEGAPPDIPGLEFAGTVEALGDGVEGWSLGDRVMGLVGGGGYAEYVTVPASHALHVPESLTLEQAAAVPEAYLTAHDALFAQGSAQAPERDVPTIRRPNALPSCSAATPTPLGVEARAAARA